MIVVGVDADCTYLPVQVVIPDDLRHVRTDSYHYDCGRQEQTFVRSHWLSTGFKNRRHVIQRTEELTEQQLFFNLVVDNNILVFKLVHMFDPRLHISTKQNTQYKGVNPFRVLVNI